MRIAIDISSIVYGTGVSVYTRNLVKNLLKVDSDNEYLLFAGTWRQREKLEKYYQSLCHSEFISESGNGILKQVQDDDVPPVKMKILPVPPRLQAVLWNDWHVLNLENLIGPVDVYHSVDWSLAPTKAKTVITVHDLFFLKRPDLQQHPFRNTLELRLKRARDKKIMAIAVSESTKKDLVELLDYPEKLVTVIYESLDSNFGIMNDELRIKKVLKKYGISGPYLFMVGTREPRKNLERTVQAFDSVVGADPSVRLKGGQAQGAASTLVIAGKVGWGDVESKLSFSRKAKLCRLLGYIPDDDKFALMRGATGFLYPSLYEGFGIPILEAFSCGTPVLTSSVSSMPEVAGRAAIYVNPDDEVSIRKGIKRMVGLSKVEREKMVKAGYEQLKKFSWEKAARETLKVYNNLANGL